MEETVHDKTPGSNNPVTYVLTHKRFNTSLISIFSDINKAQTYRNHIEIAHIMRLK